MLGYFSYYLDQCSTTLLTKSSAAVTVTSDPASFLWQHSIMTWESPFRFISRLLLKKAVEHCTWFVSILLVRANTCYVTSSISISSYYRPVQCSCFMFRFLFDFAPSPVFLSVNKYHTTVDYLQSVWSRYDWYWLWHLRFPRWHCSQTSQKVPGILLCSFHLKFFFFCRFGATSNCDVAAVTGNLCVVPLCHTSSSSSLHVQIR